MNISYILISENASSCIRHIAERLQFYIHKSTSVLLPVCKTIKKGNFLSLGRTYKIKDEIYNQYCKKIKNEGFVLFPLNNNLFFIGNTEREICYAVYDYLERCYGIRFLTAKCEYIPTCDKVKIPKDTIISCSDFFMRTYLTGDVFQKYADYDFILKTKTNDVFTQLPLKYGGHNKVYGRNQNHNFHCYVPFEIYGNEHPEFYRFFYVNGEINYTVDLTNGITDEGDLDESMDISVAKIVIEEFKKDIISMPDIDVFNFTQEDGNFPYCSKRTSEQVKKYKRSGILIRFCNVVIRKLNEFSKKELNGRQIKLVTFAYLYTKEAPVKTEKGKVVPIDETVIADENLILQLALFTNGTYSFLSDKQFNDVTKAFKEWKIIGNKFWLWGYDIDFHRYLAFYNSFNRIKENVLEMKNYGITYLCINGPYESHYNWQANIRAYAYRKIMWDSSLNESDLIDEYINIYYGQGALAVKRIIKMFTHHFDRLSETGCDLVFTSRGSGSDCGNVPLNLLEEGIRIIKIAEDNLPATVDNEYLFRLERIRFSLEFFIFDNRENYLKDFTVEELTAIKDRLFDLGKRCGIDYIGERWTLSQQKTEEETKLKLIKKNTNN